MDLIDDEQKAVVSCPKGAMMSSTEVSAASSTVGTAQAPSTIGAQPYLGERASSPRVDWEFAGISQRWLRLNKRKALICRYRDPHRGSTKPRHETAACDSVESAIPDAERRIWSHRSVVEA